MHPANKWLIGVASAALIGSTALWEGERLVPYEDIGGVVTVCYGYTGNDIDRSKTYTRDECRKLLSTEVKEHGMGILKCVKAPMKEHHYNAFTLFAYNVGVSGACNSRAIRLFNEGKISEACDALAFSPSGKPAWSYVNGKFVQGLHNRRLYERSWCLGATHPFT